MPKRPALKLIVGGKSKSDEAKVSSRETPLISEFYVHAVLQAARAERLGLDADSAKSWAMNRAIFYEAAKKGYIQRGRKRAKAGGRSGARFKRPSNFGRLFSLGGEKAYAVEAHDGGVRFVIGGKAQSPDVFDRQIKKRFPNWNLVWSEALAVVDRAGPRVLKSASRFHAQVYKAWRDLLATRWPRGQSALPEIRAAA